MNATVNNIPNISSILSPSINDFPGIQYNAANQSNHQVFCHNQSPIYGYLRYFHQPINFITFGKPKFIEGFGITIHIKLVKLKDEIFFSIIMGVKLNEFDIISAVKVFFLEHIPLVVIDIIWIIYNVIKKVADKRHFIPIWVILVASHILSPC